MAATQTNTPQFQSVPGRSGLRFYGPETRQFKNLGPVFIALLGEKASFSGTLNRLRHFSDIWKIRWGKPVMASCAAYVEVSVTNTPPRPSRVAPRSSAQSELQALLDEIPTWPDAMLTHMYTRFGSSRLFRLHHDADGPLTERAQQLRFAALCELERRGLEIPSDEVD